MPNLACESYVFDPRPNYPLVLTANRYWNPSSQADPNALTILFAHGTGFHKEQWKPTIDDLYEILGDKAKIWEVWSIDAPNHGDAAIINEKTLLWGYEPIFNWEEYARSLHAFIAGLGKGIDVDFSTRRLVGIGHSMGAVSFMLSTTYFPSIKFEALVLVEPMLFPQGAAGDKAQSFLVNGAAKRRDIWKDKEDARAFFSNRPAWKIWDPRVLDAFLDHGLRPLPAASHPGQTEGVTLKCSKLQETACYRDTVGPPRSYRYLSALLQRVPTHAVFGAIDDYIPATVKDEVLNNVSGGIDKFASVSRVPGAGHLVVQIKPRELAKVFSKILLTIPDSDITFNLRPRL